jgi:hypothetical protein
MQPPGNESTNVNMIPVCLWGTDNAKNPFSLNLNINKIILIIYIEYGSPLIFGRNEKRMRIMTSLVLMCSRSSGRWISSRRKTSKLTDCCQRRGEAQGLSES